MTMEIQIMDEGCGDNIWMEWVMGQIPNPTYLITLTYAYELSPPRANTDLQGLIAELNRSALGKRWRKKVGGNSCFSYFFVVTPQRRIHIHGVVKSEIDINVVKRYWRDKGNVRIELPQDATKAIRYVAGHMKARGAVSLEWFRKKEWVFNE